MKVTDEEKNKDAGTKCEKRCCGQDAMTRFKNAPLGFRFRLIHLEFVRHLREGLQENDLTYSQMMILRYLDRHEGENIDQKELCDALNVSHPTMVGLLSRMEEKEMIVRGRDPGNKRRKSISLGTRGNEIVEAQRKERRENDVRLVDGFTDEEKSELDKLLEKIYMNLLKGGSHA
ncbi:MAG: MarR family winged helix-turn-helix transcriptional regulator [Eubacterium sp.]|jgi:MarR family transcriptional repressor of mepA